MPKVFNRSAFLRGKLAPTFHIYTYHNTRNFFCHVLMYSLWWLNLHNTPKYKAGLHCGVLRGVEAEDGLFFWSLYVNVLYDVHLFRPKGAWRPSNTVLQLKAILWLYTISYTSYTFYKRLYQLIKPFDRADVDHRISVGRFWGRRFG